MALLSRFRLRPHSDLIASDAPPAKPTLVRRVTSKLHIAIPFMSEARPRPPRAQKPLPPSVVSRGHREAALRERGLLPPRKDFSQQEREADGCLGRMPSPTSISCGGSTEAERVKASWLATQRTDHDGAPSLDPPLTENRPDLGRPSLSSSLPPLSTSYLEVLHEDPSEHGPVTPPPPLSPVNPPIIISSPLDYPVIVESPISCAFSSHFPGSTLESHAHLDHPPPVPKKDHHRSPASRRRTVDSDDRPRRTAGATLSRLGTRSLTNLGRSVTDSLRRQSISTLSSTDHTAWAAQAPRTAISPTIHSLGSILRETRDIADAESRRLSELAFLD